MSRLYFALLLALAMFLSASAQCPAPGTPGVVPFANQGISTTPSSTTVSQAAVDAAVALAAPLPLYVVAIQQFTPAGNAVETPVLFRQNQWVGLMAYMASIYYHPTALDIYGRPPPFRFCLNDTAQAQDLFNHQTLAITYSFIYAAADVFPEDADTFTNFLTNFLGLNYSLVLDPVATADPTTPWGLARRLYDENVPILRSDGWNSRGDLSRDFNKMRYEDFTAVVDGNAYNGYTEGEFKPNSKKWGWIPLLESNGVGYFSRQEHVSPYIGYTGRLFGMTEAEFNNLTVGPPEDYGYTNDYEVEADFALEETRLTANNDTRKMFVEFFDPKLDSIFPINSFAFFNWYLNPANGQDPAQLNFEFWKFEAILNTVFYQGTLAVWREKVRYNRARPTSVVQALRDGQVTQTYGGPGQGEQAVSGDDWEPYIRTMPHAEYPSASACFCQGSVDVTKILFGNQVPNGPLGPVTFPLIPVGGSRIEPGITPSQPFNYTWTNFDEVSEICGASRVWGGMHFAGAVPAGKDLCGGNKLATPIIDLFDKLTAGDPSGRLLNFTTGFTIRTALTQPSTGVTGGSISSTGSTLMVAGIVGCVAAVCVAAIVVIRRRRRRQSQKATSVESVELSLSA